MVVHNVAQKAQGQFRVRLHVIWPVTGKNTEGKGSAAPI